MAPLDARLSDKLLRDRAAADRAMRLGLALSREDALVILDCIPNAWARSLADVLRERWLALPEPEGTAEQLDR